MTREQEIAEVVETIIAVPSLARAFEHDPNPRELLIAIYTGMPEPALREHLRIARGHLELQPEITAIQTEIAALVAADDRDPTKEAGLWKRIRIVQARQAQLEDAFSVAIEYEATLRRGGVQ
jgi:hypothetical protein